MADFDPQDAVVSSQRDLLWVEKQGHDGGCEEGELRACKAGESLLKVVGVWDPKGSGNDKSLG